MMGMLLTGCGADSGPTAEQVVGPTAGGATYNFRGLTMPSGETRVTRDVNRVECSA